MPHFFDKTEHRIELRARVDVPNRGFRRGQLGALHAAMAHFSLNQEPATICLPTGYGKTAVMMALPFLRRANRVLIVEPSDALRRQVHSHFAELTSLRKFGVLGDATPNPRACRLESRPGGEQEWRELEEYDVVVSTPNSSSPAVAPGAASDMFDLVIFDEAHHVPAESWAAYLDYYRTAEFVFLTATPFRRDKRLIPGKLVYRYPISYAAQEGAFETLRFVAAPEENRDNDEIDRSIARTAAEQLRADRAAGLNHRLLARAATISSGRRIADMYVAEGLKVKSINSALSKRRQEEVEKSLKDGDLDGIVCVDMFGEGYDFPSLKIAALHAPHQTLVPTIQFVGRFSRVDPETGVGTLVAAASRVSGEIQEVLKEGVDMAALLDKAALVELTGIEPRGR